MSNLITSKRFAERWPFAAAVLTMTGLGLELALVRLQTSMLGDAKLFCFIIMTSVWYDLVLLRVRHLGFPLKRWHLMLAMLAMGAASVYAYHCFHTVGIYFAAAFFLLIHAPLIAMRDNIPTPEIF